MVRVSHVVAALVLTVAIAVLTWVVPADEAQVAETSRDPFVHCTENCGGKP